VQYQNSRYSDRLKELEVVQSMSRKGNCLDNAPTENFFGRLKEEMWYNHEYESAPELIQKIHEYIKYYNEIRIVTKLKSSPIDYRNKVLKRT
jgi:Transposase and inactivated derivatives